MKSNFNCYIILEIQLSIRDCYLKGLFINFKYITFFSCPTKRNIFCKRSISIKPLLTRNNWEKREHKVSPTEYYYIYYIYNTDWLCAPFFLNYFESRVVLSRWTFYKKCFFRWGTKKTIFFKNWWTIPLKVRNTS